MHDVASRLEGRVELTTDAHAAYPPAVEEAFVQKVGYHGQGGDRQQLRGAPEPNHADAHEAVHPQEQRLLEKGREPRPHGGLYAIHYNFCRIHGSLRVTPTIEAGLADTAYDMS